MPDDIPVYLFTGFLESGKTKFIQGTLEDPRFSEGEKTLVLVCEEGIEEYDASKLDNSISFVNIEDQEHLNPVYLGNLVKKYNAEKVVIEYNGTWMLDKLFLGMPQNWVIYQEFSFADSNTFFSYNQNMRQLVYDKISTCDAIVFNRFDKTKIKDEDLHKIVRAISRKCEIFYESPDGEAYVDEIVDPLPYDMNAKVIKIEDKDYAIWYRDMSENMPSYEGKTVMVTGLAGESKVLSGGDFVFGRQMMTCCVEDIRMAAFACEWKGEKPQVGRWVTITGTISIKKNKAYGSKPGPVIAVSDIKAAVEPEDPVATFY